VIRLFDLPHDTAREKLRTGAPVYLTVNPVEYHGPHLSLHNDRLLSLGLCRDLHARLSKKHPEWPFLVGDDLELGVDPCPGRGTRHTAFSNARATVREACRALVELGAQRIVIMTFHGAPLHNLAIEAGITLCGELGARAIAPFNLVLEELLDVNETEFESALASVPAEARAEVLRDLSVDFHAGFFETSVALHYAPDSVSPRHRELPGCARPVPSRAYEIASRVFGLLGRSSLSRDLAFAAIGMGWSSLRPFPGYTGRPDLATKEAGAAFATFMLDRYEEATLAVFEGQRQSPPPIMAWVEKATFGGRLPALPRPPLSDMAFP
jgi:creatinine amidohydrolase